MIYKHEEQYQAMNEGTKSTYISIFLSRLICHMGADFHYVICSENGNKHHYYLEILWRQIAVWITELPKST